MVSARRGCSVLALGPDRSFPPFGATGKPDHATASSENMKGMRQGVGHHNFPQLYRHHGTLTLCIQTSLGGASLQEVTKFSDNPPSGTWQLVLPHQ